MHEEKPHFWSLVPVDGEMRVMASWSGGYLWGDSWKLNSGVASAEEDKDSYLFVGHSGSRYRCRKGAYGATGCLRSVLSYLGLAPLEEDAALRYIDTLLP